MTTDFVPGEKKTDREKSPRMFDLDSFEWRHFPMNSKQGSTHVDLPTKSLYPFLKSIPYGVPKKVLKECVQAIITAASEGGTIVWAVGGELLQAGASPLLVDLMSRGVVSALCLDGDAARYDVQMGLYGRAMTAQQELGPGAGLWKEVGAFWGEAAQKGRERRLGLGRSLGRSILRQRSAHAGESLLACAARNEMPATIHFTHGCLGPELHPDFSGADFGEVAQMDLRILMHATMGLERSVWCQFADFMPLGKLLGRILVLLRDGGMEPVQFITAFFGTDPRHDMKEETKAALDLKNYEKRRVYFIPGPYSFLLPLFRAFFLQESSMSDIFRDI